MYLTRSIELILTKSVTEFPIVALMGPRQVGKSTILKHLFALDYTYLTFDDMSLRSQARTDPALFLKNNPGNLILDEIQYAPELLPELKIAVDSRKKPGMFILTGSQQFSLIRGMRETLAGRVLLLDLPVLTCHERAGLGKTEHWLAPLLKTGVPVREFFICFPEEMSPLDAVFRGGLPGISGMSDDFINPYFKSYVQTYLERDLPAQFDMRDAVQLSRFLHLLAPLSSHEINKHQIGRELGVSPPTAGRWLTWLKSSLVWHEHEPYHGNIIKRISKHPKGFLFDTGLICGLLHVPDTSALASHPLLGSLFETAMRIEIEAAIANTLMPAYCRHWRTPYGQEVDLVIEYGGRLFAFECRWNSRVTDKDAAHLRFFKKQYGDAVAFMGILTPYGRLGLVDEDIYQIPWFMRE